MRIKVLIIGVVKKGDSILMRKKPDGSLPYKETWYLFGGEFSPDKTPEEVIINELSNKAGISISVTKKLSWNTEVKKDLDGKTKLFVYLDMICEYLEGDLRISEGIEKLEWIPTTELVNYDIVPPSKTLFKRLGYLKD